MHLDDYCHHSNVQRGGLLRVNSTLIKNNLNDSLYIGRSLSTDFNNPLVRIL